MEPRFGHDFSRVRVHADGPAGMAAHSLDATAFTAGSHIVFAPGRFSPRTTEGRRLLAHELAHVVQQSGPSSHGGAIPRVHGAQVVQRQLGGMNRNPLEDNERFLRLVERIGSYGLPIKFMPPLAKTFAIYMDSRKNGVMPTLRTILLKSSTSQEAEKYLEPQGKVGESIALMNIYHECTHAFLTNVRRDKQLAKVIREGMAHYAGAPLEKGRTATDPEELFQEAAATYVGSRVEVYWSALERLVPAGQKALSVPPGPGVIAAFLDSVERAAKLYDEAMSRRIFGYQTVDGSQVSTTKPISTELKAYLDEQVLEGKIPDRFADAAALQHMVNHVVETRIGR